MCVEDKQGNQFGAATELSYSHGENESCIHSDGFISRYAFCLSADKSIHCIELYC